MNEIEEIEHNAFYSSENKVELNREDFEFLIKNTKELELKNFDLWSENNHLKRLIRISKI